MQPSSILSRTLLSTAGALLLLSSGSAFATTALTENPGDVFIGFHDSTNSQDYLIDIGPSTAFENATAPITLTLGNIAADLSAVFGPNWQTDPTLMWGVIGTNTDNVGDTIGNDPDFTLFVSRLHGAVAPHSLTSSTQATISSRFEDMANFYVSKDNGQTQNFSTGNSPVALIQNTTDANSYDSKNPAANSFGLGFSIEQNFANGTAAAGLDFYRLVPAAGSPAATELGIFSINDSGTITFNPVPEPSSLVSLVAGAGMLGLLRRRRKSVAR